MLPIPYTVGHKVFQEGAEDAHGNLEDGWADPVYLPVSAIAPGAMAEPRESNRDVSMVLYTLFCPAGTQVGVQDLIVLQGKDYDVDGTPQDFTQGPWPTDIAGVVIYLKDVQG